jgi:hypothetical protein
MPGSDLGAVEVLKEFAKIAPDEEPGRRLACPFA